MKLLVLPVKRKWFELIKSGEKDHEYRLLTDYWTKRLVGKEYSRVVVTLGYPKRDDGARRLVFPWRGFTRALITCDEFGSDPVSVYAIRLWPEAVDWFK